MDTCEVRSHAKTPSCPHDQEAYTQMVSLRSYYSTNPKQLQWEFQILVCNFVHEEWEKVSVPNVLPVFVMLNCPESEEIAHKSCSPKTDRKCTVVAKHGQAPSCYCKTASTDDVTVSIWSTLNSILKNLWSHFHILLNLYTKNERR